MQKKGIDRRFTLNGSSKGYVPIYMSTFRAVIIGTAAAVAGYFISTAIMSYLFHVPLLGQ